MSGQIKDPRAKKQKQESQNFMGGEKNDLAPGIIVNGSARRPENRDIKKPNLSISFPAPWCHWSD